MKLTYFKNMSRILFLATIVFSFTNCNKDVVKPEQEKVSPKPQFSIIAAEGFESGTKTAYAGATVTLSTGNWYLNEALIGNSTSDRKAGTKSARVRDLGKLTMQFNVTGASTISVKHTIYGTDLSSTWQLWASTNSGSTWTQVGSTITTSSTTLQTVNFTANYTSAVRFEIRKVSGGSNRINIDDISIDYSGGGGSGDDGSGSVHLTMGNPSSAITNTTYPDNYLMVKNQYALSYNKSKATCNWVAWHLNTSWIGSTPRQDDFRADATLPSGWYQVGSSSYSGSGFDRGHMCPSADRTASVADNSSTFLMTNMVPQAPDNNQGPWANLEDYCRTLANAGNELYIYSGVSGTGGTGSNGSANTINNGNITVPAYTWKVILVIPNGSNDVSRVSTSSRVIAVKMPNTQGIRTVNWGTYRVKVDDVETLTGNDFFTALSTTLQSSLESVVDSGPTN